MEDNIVTTRASDGVRTHRTGVWWTFVTLHAMLVVFYFVWFVVGVTVALWVEILPGCFGRFVELALGPVTLLGGMLFYLTLICTTSLIALRRSPFESVRKMVLGALYLSCIFALGIYASNMFYVVHRPESKFEPERYIVQMNVYTAVYGFPLSVILSVLAVLLFSQTADDKAGAIQLPDDA